MRAARWGADGVLPLLLLLCVLSSAGPPPSGTHRGEVGAAGGAGCRSCGGPPRGTERWGVLLASRRATDAREAVLREVIMSAAAAAAPPPHWRTVRTPCARGAAAACATDIAVFETPAGGAVGGVLRGWAAAGSAVPPHLRDLGVRRVFEDLPHRRRVLATDDTGGGDAVNATARRPHAARSSSSGARAPSSSDSIDVVRTLKIGATFWDRGIRGGGVKVAVFDTGIAQHHAAFRSNHHVAQCVDYTGAPSCEDGLGHGSFVAGLITSQQEGCMGMAGDADVYVFKVFTDRQESYTSWFLEALNHAIDIGVDVLNLSVGGPDYMDGPFMDKVVEAGANGITVVSAIGNSGPLYGTLNNPADMLSVVGVGAVTQGRRVARFSSRGMTTWELPEGYGRAKPDVMTYGDRLWSASHSGGCKALSGTSVAAPVVAGLCANLVALARKVGKPTNHAFLKQALTATARPLAGVSVYEQGAGVASAPRAAEWVATTTPAPSVFPDVLDLYDCGRWWPHCRHPLFATGMPVTVNLTVLNPLSLRGRITGAEWTVATPDAPWAAEIVDVRVEYSSVLWPHVGWLAVSLSVKPGAARAYEGRVSGTLNVAVAADTGTTHTAAVQITVEVIKPPPRARRLLWDVYHNMFYPPDYVARDDLQATKEALDWNGDHPHTNFKDTFEFVVGRGYHVDILTADFTAFDAQNYAALLLVDTEEAFDATERAKLQRDIAEHGLALIVFADWYNEYLMAKATFVDDNTGQTWTPIVGGANIPALNELLAPYDVALSASVFSGVATVAAGIRPVYQSGTSIARFPAGGRVWCAEGKLVDVGATRRARDAAKRKGGGKHAAAHAVVDVERVPVLGITAGAAGPRIAVFGDSDCLDSAHTERFCHDLLEGLLAWAATGGRELPRALADAACTMGTPDVVWEDPRVALPDAPAPGGALAAHSHALHGAEDMRAHDHRPTAVVSHRKRGVRAVGLADVAVHATHAPPVPATVASLRPGATSGGDASSRPESAATPVPPAVLGGTDVDDGVVFVATSHAHTAGVGASARPGAGAGIAAVILWPPLAALVLVGILVVVSLARRQRRRTRRGQLPSPVAPPAGRRSVTNGGRVW